MIIAHITTVPTSLRFLTGQVGHMRSAGFQICAVSSPGSDLGRFADEEKMPTHAVAMPRRISPVQDIVAILRLCQIFRQTRPQIVHSHTPKGGLLGIIAAWLCRVPVRIYHMRGLPMTSKSGLKRLLLKWTERVSCSLSHEVLCVSHSLRDVAVAERLCPARKIRVLAHGSGQGVDAAGRFNPGQADVQDGGRRLRRILEIPDSALVLGFVGRIVRDKGVHELVAAWRQLRTEFPSLHLLIVGHFESEDPIGRDAEQALGGDERVHLLGFLEDMPCLYANLDVLVLPTYREGFPNVLLEAAAMEVPAVATKVPGCFDAIEDGATGTLVPARDAEALAAAVSRYLVDPELRQRHGRAGRQRVLRDFRPEVIWEAIYQEYVRLLRQHGLTLPEPRSNRSMDRRAA